MEDTKLEKDRAALAAKLAEFARRPNREIHDAQLAEVMHLAGTIGELYGGSEDAPTLELGDSVIYETLSLSDVSFPALSLRSCNFQTPVTFTRVTFTGPLILSGSAFYGAVRFSNCEFKGKLHADHLNINGHFDLSGSRFRGDVYFRDCHFHHEAQFANCHFERFTYFHNSKFDSLADFSFSYFFTVWFNNVTFGEMTSFSKAIFTPRAPRFHNAILHRDTSFAGAVFNAFEQEQDWRAYRTLKQHMADVKAQEEESFFFAHEQRARRKFRSEFAPASRIKHALHTLKKNLTTIHQDTIIAPSAFNSSISFLYDIISNYGQNIARPFMLWLAQVTGFATLFLWHTHRFTANSDWLKSGEMHDQLTAVMLSLQNSLNPLALFSKEPLVSVSSLPMLLISLAQAITSIGLITLGLLAVRRRFHKGSE